MTSVISKADFERMSAALVWMGITPECKQEWTPMSGNSTTSCDHTKERYLYGSVGIFLIWLCSFSAVFGVSRFTRTKYFKTYLVMCLRALAIGTLLGDALMHIIPSVSWDNRREHYSFSRFTLYNKRSILKRLWAFTKKIPARIIKLPRVKASILFGKWSWFKQVIKAFFLSLFFFFFLIILLKIVETENVNMCLRA